ncbi:xylulokinase [Tenggerimyces flavus]|uniref:FGGY-family carbohydrate kinase n=1 Tax=Tenggerimyces flavus TaxID=1708749 RepID=A0ABV7YMZ4_9ACTN|nr:FGGY family carbohydrate kinase [Tenggerimyces flavus]MBM7790469.1 xylulokinase [Tenggerimyces flavus]
MGEPVTVGVDVGTTGVKAVVVSAAGRVLGEAGQEYATAFPAPNAAEQSPQDWWAASAAVIRAALAQAGAVDVAAVGVSSQAPTVVVLDKQGDPVRPALTWMDRRGVSECERLDGTEVLRRTGNRLDAYFAAPKLAWLLRAEPEVRHRGQGVLMANGYVVRQLTGEATIDTGHVGLTLLGSASGWDENLVAEWGIPRSWLPEPVDPADVVGHVTTKAARATGLRAGTPVVAGLVDGAAASIEAGLAEHGDVCEMTGQSTVVNAAVETARLGDGPGTLSTLPYPLDGLVIVYGSMVATGGILRWFRDELGGGDFAELDTLAGTAPVGSGGVVLLPYFLGERSPIWDADARGALVGLSMGTRRADLVRAILEGTAYGLAHNLAELSKLGINPEVLRSIGGGSRGRTWTQIKADVTGLPVEVPAHSAGAPVGVAMVAASGVGLVPSLRDAVLARRSGPLAFRASPDSGRHATYERLLEVYRELYPALTRVHALLAGLRSSV